MAKRDYVAEISARRERLRRRGPRSLQFDKRVDALIDVHYFLQKSRRSDIPSKDEMVKYLPVGWVACIEGYFRLVFRDLIDHGHPYRENAANLKDIRIGLEHVVAMQAGKFTLGEFVSHLLPLKGLEDINQAMSTILGLDYLEALKKTKTDVFEKSKSLEDLGFSGAVFNSMEFLFTQRHMFAHELMPKGRVSLRDIFHHSRAALVLINCNESLLETHLGKVA